MLTTTVGAATITVVDVYDIPTNLVELLQVRGPDETPADTAELARPVALPVNCIVIQLAGQTVLVDAGDYEAALDSAPRPGYPPPPDLLAQLAARGVDRAAVGAVVITHTHGDHFNALTVEQNGEYRPTFPNACCYVGRADWENARMQTAVQQPDSLEYRTLGVIARAGLLQTVEGNLDLGPGVQIVAGPGETPGHQLVRVSSGGETLYCLGDLYHHTLEVSHPTWRVPWADAESMGASRRALVAAALAENARLIATHIPGIGRLQRTAAGVTWAATG